MSVASLTIAIPAYNVQHYIDDCMSSVAKALRADDRVIVVDDGSTDQTPERLAHWAHVIGPACQVIRTANGGNSHARNLALDLIDTDYVLFMDSDDVLDPQVLDRARGQGWPEGTDIIEFDFEYLRGTRLRPAVRSSTPAGALLRHQDDIVLHVLERAQFYTWQRLWRTAFLKALDGPLFPPGRKFEDITSTTLNALRARTLFYAGGALIHYRQREGSIMSSCTAEKSLDLARSLQTVAAEARRTLRSPQTRLAYDRLALTIAYWALKDWVSSPDRHQQNPQTLFQQAIDNLISPMPHALAALAQGPREDRRLARRLSLFQRSPRMYLAWRQAAWRWRQLLGKTR